MTGVDDGDCTDQVSVWKYNVQAVMASAESLRSVEDNEEEQDVQNSLHFLFTAGAEAVALSKP